MNKTTKPFVLMLVMYNQQRLMFKKKHLTHIKAYAAHNSLCMTPHLQQSFTASSFQL